MIETRSETILHSLLPEQRYPTISADFSVPADIELAVDLLADKEVLIINNDSVYAVIGDAYSQDFIPDITMIKHSNIDKVYGAMLDTENILELADMTELSPKVLGAFQKSQSLLSGLAFLRFPIKKEVVSLLPELVKSYDEKTQAYYMQNYDPRYKTNVAQLVDAARPKGLGLPIITSLNRSGEKEIVDRHEAEEFIDGMGRFILHDKHAKRMVRGSYTIFSFDKEGLTLKREGNIATEIFRSIFDECEIRVPEDVRRCAYPEYQLNFSDVPDLKKLHGAELAHTLRQRLGWEQQ